MFSEALLDRSQQDQCNKKLTSEDQEILAIAKDGGLGFRSLGAWSLRVQGFRDLGFGV